MVRPDPARLVRQASEALLAGAGRAGVALGVDDAHLLDELSATLVHQLVLRRAATVVLTLRTGEPAPDAVTALWKDGHLTRLELQPLSADEITTLVEARLGGSVDSSAARRLWSITPGQRAVLAAAGRWGAGVTTVASSRRVVAVVGRARAVPGAAGAGGGPDRAAARRAPRRRRDLAFGEPLECRC